mgnify:CR=1 FL=1
MTKTYKEKLDIFLYMEKKCFHCKKNVSYSLCNDCRFNKNIMMTATNIKKNYKVSENELDADKIYNETYKTQYHTYGTSYYLPHFYKYFMDVIYKNFVGSKLYIHTLGHNSQ